MGTRVRGRSDDVHGSVELGFGPLADTFRQQFADGKEVGAACAAYRDGRLVVDLWGGYRDGPGRQPWERDTLVPVFSTTKGMASMAFAVAHSRDYLNLDEPVATYWPAFAQNGKARITVRQLMSHQAGLVALDAPIGEDLLADRDALEERLAHLAPLWEPGAHQGYHAVTFGFYLSALLRHADPAGRSIGRAFAEDVADPLGIDFYIGLPDDIEDRRLATFHGIHPARGLLHIGSAPRGLLLAFMNPRSLTSRAFKALPAVQHPEQINDRALLRHEVASWGGIGDANGIARAFGDLATGGHRLGLRPATVAAFEAPPVEPRDGRRDLVLHTDLPFSLGFAKPFDGFPLGTDGRTYAMAGTGGSIGMADPTAGIGFSYTPNLMGFGSPTDPREVALRDALYRCIDGPPQDPGRAAGAAAGARRT